MKNEDQNLPGVQSVLKGRYTIGEMLDANRDYISYSGFDLREKRNVCVLESRHDIPDVDSSNKSGTVLFKAYMKDHAEKKYTAAESFVDDDVFYVILAEEKTYKNDKQDVHTGSGSEPNPKKTVPGIVLAAAAVVVCLLIAIAVNRPKDTAKEQTAGTAAESEPRSEMPDTEQTVSVGDYIIFGEYEQDNDTSNGKEEIEWLNSTFFDESFSSTEQAVIQSTAVSADNNTKYNTSPGNDTTDKIFLLSSAEALDYFDSDEERACKATAYTESKDVFITERTGNCYWWLRSPGYDDVSAALISGLGDISEYGQKVLYKRCGVRPAMWVSLKP